MSEFLFEIYSEEMPALIQEEYANRIKEQLQTILTAKEIQCSNISSFSGPCRITIYISQIDKNIKSCNEKIRGPKVGAHIKAIEGFCKSHDINQDQLRVKESKSAKYYFYHKGTESISVSKYLSEEIPRLLSIITWPKSMYWGSSKIKWIRPIRNIICIFDSDIVHFEYGNLKSNNKVCGHKFLSNKCYPVNSFKQYQDHLNQHYVVMNPIKRKEIITEGIIKESENIYCKVNIDKNLLNEVAGLVEYPSILVGKIDKEFVDMPSDILVTAIREHQKYFTLTDQNGKFAPYFIFVSNIPNNHTEIIQGNEKVIRARLKDALFFYKNDRKIKLNERKEKLKKLLFHEKLGSMYDKSLRIEEIVKLIDSNENIIEASKLSKCDLQTDIITEFPVLQGIMGYNYAKNDKLPEKVALAIRDHYKPLGPHDTIPQYYEGQILALADKIDSLVMLHIAGEKASSSKDPLGLRRIALGIIRIIIEGNINIKLKDLISHIIKIHVQDQERFQKLLDFNLQFIEERLKQHLKNQYNIALVNSIINLENNSDIVEVRNKLNQIAQLFESSAGEEILQLYKRISSLVQSNERYILDKSLLQTNAEIDLYNKINKVREKIAALVAHSQYAEALNQIYDLKKELDEFFDKILVNVDNKSIQQNRKALLAQILALFQIFGDFEAIN